MIVFMYGLLQEQAELGIEGSSGFLEHIIVIGQTVEDIVTTYSEIVASVPP